MHVQVDQSGKIEFTKDDTVLAFSNGISFTVLIPAAIKRAFVTKLRNRGLSGPTFYVQMFATALFLLLRDHIPLLSSVAIDVEYPGKESLIKEHLLNLLHRAGYRLHPHQIHFLRVGKQSPAHALALETFRGKRKPDIILDGESLLAQFR